MLPPSPFRPFRALAVSAAALALLAASARAADSEAPKTALDLVPADVAFFSSMLRNKEQVDVVAKSRAWAKLWSLPSVQQAWTAVRGEYNKEGGNLAGLRDFFNQADNKELLAFLADAASDEIFTYGDDSWLGFLELAQRLNSSRQSGPATALFSGKAGGRSAQDLQTRAVLTALAENPELVKVPNLVCGFKLKDTARAEKQIKRLEDVATAMANQSPDFKGRVKRAKVGDSSFLTLTLDGSQVPWDQIPVKDYEDKPGEFAPLFKALKTRTLAVALGVHQGYLVLSIGATTDHLARLGGAGPRLAGRAEFKPLAKFADRKLTSIGYASEALARQNASGAQASAASVVEMAKAALPQSGLPEEQQKQLLKDLDDYARTLKTEKTEAGAAASFAFLTERGYEGYAYNYGKHPEVDGSKALTLLDHLGGDPLLAAVGRGKTSIEGYEAFAKGIQILYGHADEAAKAKLTGDEKEQYLKVTADLLPLVKRLHEATAKQLLPALADGQGGLVLDAKWTSKQWQNALPAMDKAMPAPELAIVLGVSDADKLVKAMTEYRNAINEALAKARTWKGGEKFPVLEIPAPKEEKKKAGTLYVFPLPAEWGLDAQVAPTAGLSDKVAVVTLSGGHAERLLATTPLKTDGGPLADRTKALAAAVYFNAPGLVDAAAPWVEWAADRILDVQFASDAARADSLKQVRTVLEVVKCYRGSTSATYFEGEVLVTHSESVYRDLEK
jgi:hypothetical protein